MKEKIHLPESIQITIKFLDWREWWHHFNFRTNSRVGDNDAGTRSLIRKMIEDKTGGLLPRRDQREDDSA